jgi:uncharacterized surface protein with fasciclin (FAS1) repeats
MMRRAATRWALAPLAALLVACGNGKDEVVTADSVAPRPSGKTLVQALHDDAELSTLEGVVVTSRFADVLSGVGPYTVLAPVNAAFLAQAAPTDAAAAAALLSAHMLPGLVTRADIVRALSQDPDGKVEMRTLDDRIVVFSRIGDVITATAADGTLARLTGAETVTNNGVVEPIDVVLVRPAA